MDRDEGPGRTGTCVAGSRLVRGLWFAAGTAALAVGLVGIVVPLLPTTPLLLISAACYARSSPRMYRWIMCNRVVGSYMQGYLEGKGVPWRAKAVSIGLLWGVIGLSAVFFVDSTVVRLILLAVAVTVTVHIVMVRPRRA
jgi:hypothetical protein